MEVDSSSRPKQIIRPTFVLNTFRCDRQKVSIWLKHNNYTYLEGIILGYDEFMNIVLGEAVEINKKKKGAFEITNLGRILLKSDNIAVINQVGI